jgi:hypothetical protein
MVIFRDNQELQADDFLNQQAWMQQSLDHVVLDAINTAKAYSGFILTKAAQTTIKTSQGRLYSGGSVYSREDEVSIDLYNQLPVTARKYFAVVAWGQTIDEDIQPRNFLIDADTGMAEPQSVAMQRTRYCNVSTVAGNESADPQQPAVEATYLLIGYVLCDPTGVVSVEQATETQLDNLELIAARTAQLEAWRGIAQGLIDTLRTDLANLANQMLNYTLLTQFQQLVDIVNELWTYAHRPQEFQFYGSDRFLDEDESDTAANVSGAYSARIEEGLRFPPGGVGWIGQLQLSNPSDNVVQSFEGFMLPKPSGSRVRYDCSFPDRPWTPVRILTLGFWNFTVRHLTPSRWRFRVGRHYVPWPAASVWWFEAQRDPTYHILSFTTETWEIVQWKETMIRNETSLYWPRHGYDRWKYYWRDWVEPHHWAKVYTDFNHSGNHGAQVFYNAQDGWLSGITVFSHKLYYQPLSVVISGCLEDGTPDQQNHTLRRAVLSGTDLQACYDQPIHVGDIIVQEVIAVAVPHQTHVHWKKYVVYNRIPTYIWPIRISFPPVFLTQGQHFAFHVHSTFDHEFSFCDHDDAYQVVQGHWWFHDGSRFRAWLSGPRTMRFLLHYATWGRWGDRVSPGGQLRYEVNLQPLQLAGGIGGVDVLAEHIIPAATDLHYEIMVDGVWQPFTQDTPALDGSDALLPFRVVMNGTTDLMPGVSLTNSEVELTKASAPTYHHISKPITTSSTQHIKVVTKLLNYVEAHHNLDVAVYYGATYDTTGIAEDELLSDGTLVRTVTFSPASGVTSFRVIINGATDGVGESFVVGERIAFTQPPS